eukprot:CAMPEP_0113588942 /NCGR_PEP_ID=MMETSP0015_2-20120614/35809_1 /TAXON_ID=2838 /ORGANISM="Odontella" /LENGTH=340 /DNA_ID=CAMNT_0000494899 /DNA_START=4 /DNA_END=1026 /DNA_ORIENTATION=+ /assembly_acc=CAM_ASM_000160
MTPRHRRPRSAFAAQLLLVILVGVDLHPQWSLFGRSLHRRNSADAFVPQQRQWRSVSAPFCGGRLLSTASPSTSEAESEAEADPSEMRLSEMKAELKERGVSFADCFDRESLTKRLVDARDGTAPGATEPKPAADEEATAATNDSSGAETVSDGESTAPPPDSDTSPPPSSSFDREAVLSELRSLRVAELRTRLSALGIRWATMIDKDDLVRALADAMEEGANFSTSGALRPGEVADITDGELSLEVGGGASTPLLLDVYATWCGPCQMMAPQLKEAARELGSTVRVAKIDSDKYQTWASKLNVGGLPTVIVFDGGGKELQRVEGALMKDGLIELARSHI